MGLDGDRVLLILMVDVEASVKLERRRLWQPASRGQSDVSLGGAAGGIVGCSWPCGKTRDTEPATLTEQPSTRPAVA